MNIITVVFRGDLANLLYQANSLMLNWKEDVKKWHIVIEDNHITPLTKEWCEQRIVPMMEEWDVVITLAPSFIKSTKGWYRQQILKFWAAIHLSDTDYSLILDGKNFIVRPIDSKWFFVDGKLKVQVHDSENLSTPWFECCKFFNKDYKEYVRPYNLTPWVFRKDLVQHTIDQYLANGCNIYEVDELPAFEFEAYWLLNQNNIPWKGTTFLDGIMSGFNVYPTEFLLERIEIHKEFSKPFWVFHRYEHNNTNFKSINDSYLTDLKVINEELIQEWERVSAMQAEHWPNIMTGDQPPDIID